MKSTVRLSFCNMALVSGILANSTLTGKPLKARGALANLASTLSRTSWWLRSAGILLVAIGVAFGAVATAQTAHLSGYQVTTNITPPPASGDNPATLAVDANGNVFVVGGSGSNDGHEVTEWVLSGGTYTPSVVASGLPQWVTGFNGIAVDLNDNIYVATTAALIKYTLTGGSYVESVISNQGSDSGSVSVDVHGNVYYTLYPGRGVIYVPSGTGYTSTPLPYSNPFCDCLGNSFTNAFADANGIIYIYAVAQTAPGAGSAPVLLEETPSASGYTQTAITSDIPQLGVDVAGVVHSVAPPTPVGTVNSVAVDTSGTLYTTWGGLIYRSIFYPAPSAAANFGSVAVGSSTAGDFGNKGYPISPPEFSLVAVSTVFTFDTPGTLGRYTVDTGYSSPVGYDFPHVSGSCQGGGVYAAGQSCTVDVAFSPTTAGPRFGAAYLADPSGNIMATGYFQGTGAAPMAVVYPGTQSVLFNSASNGLSQPSGMAIDNQGDVYIADTANNQVLGFSPQGTQIVIANVPTNGLSGPTGIAIDGSGAVFIADTGNNRVVKEALSEAAGLCINSNCTGNLTYTQSIVALGLSGPRGVAADGAGNIYVADTGNNRILLETPSSTGYTQSILIDSGLASPTGIAVDGSGNLYIANADNGEVVKETPSGGSYTQSTVASGLIQPQGVSLDPAGNVYIADSGNNRVLLEVYSNGSYTQSVIASGLNSPQAFAVNTNINYLNHSVGFDYISDSGNQRVLQIDLANQQALNFATTPVGGTSSDSPQTLMLFNIGNVPLQFTVPATGNNPSLVATYGNAASAFTLASGDAADCPVVSAGASEAPTLAAGASCLMPISFTPNALDPGYGNVQADTMSLIDNSLNPTQTAFLTGKAMASVGTVTTLSSSLNASTYSQPVTFTATVTQTSGTIVPTGTVQFSVDGTPVGSPATLIGGQATYATSSLTAGTHSITAVYTPDSGSAFTGSSATALSQVVSQATPTITWPTPAAIPYGTALSTTQLNATASTDGAFVYTPAAGTALGAGSQTLSVTFTPADTGDYTTATSSVTLVVVPPQLAAHLSGYRTTTNITASGAFNQSVGLAVDQSGNIYIPEGNPYNLVVKEALSAGAYTQSVLASASSGGLSNPQGIAVDGKGNVFVADGNRVIEETPSGGGYTQTLIASNLTPVGTSTYLLGFLGNGSFQAVAVDANGNVYATMPQYGNVIKLAPSGGSYTASIISIPSVGGSSFFPNCVAVDGSGNLYVGGMASPQGYSTGYAFKETLSGDTYTSSTIPVVGSVNGIALDATGNVYTSGSGVVEEFVPVAGGYAPGTNITSLGGILYGVAADASGNVFVVAGSTGTLFEVSTSTGNFGNVNVGSATAGNLSGPYSGNPTVPAYFDVAVSAIFTFDTAGTLGNHEVVNGAGVYNAEFPELDDNRIGTCNAGAVYAAGVTCTEDITFSPYAQGLRTGTVILTDTSGSTIASAPVQGTGAIQSGTTTTLGTSLSPSPYGQSVTFTATVAPAYGTTVPTGTVQFSVDGTPSGSPVTLGSGQATYAISSLTIGTHSITAVYSPDSGSTFTGSSATALSQVVNQATPAITWPTPTAINYGTALSAAQLDASSPVDGSFSYSPALGTVLGPGSQTLSVAFTPTDTTDYTTATATVQLIVNQATPTVTWSTPAAINYRTALSATQLNATASVPGTFVYSPGTGTVLEGGSQLLSVTFTPTDATDYAAATANVTLVVNPIAQTITFPALSSPVTYGVGPITVPATASSTLPVTFSATGPATVSGNTLIITGAGAVVVTASQAGNNDYNAATSVSRNLTVSKATPVSSLSASETEGSYGDSITLTATLTGGDVPPSGAVTFRNGGTSIGTGTLSGGIATLTTTALPTGSDNLTATYTGDSNYKSATSNTFTITLSQQSQSISFTLPSAVTFGVSPITLSATATSGLAVTFSVTGPATLSGSKLTITGAGTVVVTASQAGNANYPAATSVSQTLIVNQATPTITWANPAAITYGTALSATQLKAKASVAGTFAYTPAAGTVLAAGTQPLNVTFTPTDTADYTTATGSATLVVNPAPTAITWTNPAAITYGTALGATQLNASSSVSGTYVYTPSAGTVLTVGSQTLSVTLTPDDTTDYTTATKTVTITVKQAKPTITWATPASIPYGTPLGAAQQNATASTDGTFTYSPAAGTVLGVGTHNLSVTFTPTDTTDYSNATATVSQTVTIASQTINFNTPSSPVVYGVAPITLSATASSGLTVKFSVLSGPGTVSGSTLAITGAGTVVVAANQAGNGSYTAAAQVTQTVVVNQATPGITLSSSANTVAHGTAVTFTATLTGGSAKPTGTVVFLDGTTQLGMGTLNGGGVGKYTTTSLAVGGHSITASYGGDTNYLTTGSTAVGVTVQ